MRQFAGSGVDCGPTEYTSHRSSACSWPFALIHLSNSTQADGRPSYGPLYTVRATFAAGSSPGVTRPVAFTGAATLTPLNKQMNEAISKTLPSFDEPTESQIADKLNALLAMANEFRCYAH